MSSSNSTPPSSNSKSDSFSIMSLCSKVTLDGTNYNDWYRNIKIALRYEDKEYVLERELIEIDENTATPEEKEAYNKHYADATKVACLMVATMPPELQRFYEDYWPYEMNKDLAEKFRKRAHQGKYEVVKSLMAIGQGKGKKRKGPPKQNWKGKSQASSSRTKETPHVPNPKEAECFYCQEKGHWKKSCPKYLQDIKDGKVKPSSSGIYTIQSNNLSSHNSWVLDTGCGFHICCDLQGLKESEEVKHGRISLIMGNRRRSPVTKIGTYSLVLSNNVRLDLNNCCFSSEMTRNIISFHALFKQGYEFYFDNLDGIISVYKDGCLIFNAIPCDGVYETVQCVENNINSVFQIDSSNSIDKACLWHCRLGHINKKRMAQLQKDGVLESFDLKSDDTYESCILGKMTKSPFTGSCERGEGLLDLIHTDVCGPFRTTTKDANRFYVTFTDDYSRYGYIYLIKHKSETFEKFKEFKHEVENQLGRKIKMLRSDRGGEYLSIEFNDYLKECGIVSQLTPPRTPQLNGVAERRNRTLLYMVRSMMSRAALPIHFWGYALETAAHILNIVP
ncbi:DDE-type integrase/transposase/recombinase, partial [Labilibacter sediminis]